MKAITKSGTVYEVKFRNTKDPFYLYLCERGERALSWQDFGGLINISGEWYHCQPELRYIDDKMTPYVCLSHSAIKALNIETQKKVLIRLDSIPEEEFKTFYKDLIQSTKEKANALSFTYIEFTDYFICGSDCAGNCDYLYFNEKALNILNAFKAIEKFEDRLKFTSCFDGYNTTYRVDGTNMDKLFALAAPKLKDIEAKREKKRRKRRL